MPRREIWQLRPGGQSAPPTPVWVEREPRSSLVSVADPDEPGRARSSIVIRMRWRNDVSLASVLEGDGLTWRVNEATEVGKRWLDLAVSAYELIDTAAAPADTETYTAQAGYTLALNGRPVQYLQAWEAIDFTHPLTGATTPAGWVLRNYGAAGSIPASVQIEAPNGARGRMNVRLGGGAVSVAAADELIPRSRTIGTRFDFAVTADQTRARPTTWTPESGDWIRILSTTEI